MTTTEIVRAEEAIKTMDPVVADATTMARSLSSIRDHDSFMQADRYLIELKRIQKKLDDERKKLTQPLDSVKKRIMEAFAPKLKMIADAEAILKGATRRWFIQEKERQRIEEERLKKEIQKAQEDEKLAKAVTQEASGKTAEAEATISEPIMPSKPKVETSFNSAGSYGRNVWKCKVVNVNEFLKGIIDLKMSADFIEIRIGTMNRVAQNLKGKVNWPGVEVKEDVSMGVRS